MTQTNLAKVEVQSIESILKLQSEAYTQLSMEHRAALERLDKALERLDKAVETVNKQAEEYIKTRELVEDVVGDLDDQTEKVTQQLKVLIKVTEAIQK